VNPLQTLTDRLQGKAPPGAKRSPRWRKVRKRVLAGANGCSVCSRKRGIEAHHIIPFHLAPDLELDPKNLIALCRRCHLFVGHLGAWSRTNLTVRTDAAFWRLKIDQWKAHPHGG
jgi:5-methylcytosine-specific restriction endonuclease McrA